MAEISYPVLNQPMSETLWRLMARAWGSGIIDSGGAPYKIVSRSDSTNALVIGRDAVTLTAEAILNGFVHRIDTDVTLTVPTAAANYEVGIVYDPAGHGTAAGPLKLAVWAAPGDYTNNKQRLIFYTFTRASGQALTAVTITSAKSWTRPTILAETEAARPRSEQLPYGTEVLVSSNNKRYRSNGSNGWVEIPTTDPEVAAATNLATPNTIMKRSSTGTVFVSTGTNGSDATNIDWVNDKLAGKANTSHSHSWSSITSKPSTFPPSDHNHNGDDITSGIVPWARIGGSTYAYNNTSYGSTWATVAVESNGRFFRYPSALKYKTNVEPWNPDVRAGFAIQPVTYDHKETGIRGYIGVVADYEVETFPNLVQFGPDGDVEGWHYELWTVLHQAMLRDLDERVVELTRERDAEREARTALEQRLAAVEARLDKLDGGA